jgi:NAD+ kinase
MKKVAIFANAAKPQAQETLLAVASHLRKRHIEICLEQCDPPYLFQQDALRDIANSVDCIISIGGDGSLLHLVHHIGIPQCPLVGINLGSLGFLADIPLENLEASLDCLCDGRYEVSKRTVLQSNPLNGIAHFAINEVAVHRGDTPHLIDLAIHVDGLLVNTFSADGILIATPGGSTAYSLAAGGPIVTPDVPCLVLTPICPHTISNRPIVLMPKGSVSIELLNESTKVDVAFDGQKPLLLSSEKPLNLKISDQTFQLISLQTSNFFKTLRSKLGWSGSLRRP